MPSNNQLYVPSSNNFFSIALIFLGILTFIKIAIEVIQVYILGLSKWSYGPKSTFGMASENIIGKFVILMSSILLCTLIFIIFKATIPQGVWFNNEYIIIAVGLFLWFIGPAQILLKRKQYEFSPLLFLWVFLLWSIFSIFGSYLLTWIKGGQPTDHLKDSIGFTSLGVFAIVLILDKWLPHLRKPKIEGAAIEPNNHNKIFNDEDSVDEDYLYNIDENYLDNNFFTADHAPDSVDPDSDFYGTPKGGRSIRARRSKRSRR